jgi:hypothetical protein
MQVCASDIRDIPAGPEAPPGAEDTTTATLHEWSKTETPIDQLTSIDRKDPRGPVLRARSFNVQPPDAAASRVARIDSVRLTFSLPTTDARLLGEAQRQAVTKPISLACLLLPAAAESKTAPLAVLRASIVSISATGVPIHVRAALVHPTSDDPAAKMRVVPSGMLPGDRELTAVSGDAPDFGPVVELCTRRDRTLLVETDAGESKAATTRRAHLAFIDMLSATSCAQLRTEIDRATYEVTTAEKKPLVTDFVRVVLPVAAGAQPTSTLQWLTIRFWSTLAARTLTELEKASASAPELRDIKGLFFVRPKGAEPPSVLVYKDALLEVAEAALQRAGRGGVVIDASRGLALALRGVGFATPEAKAKTISAVVCVELDYAVFARPDSVETDGPAGKMLPAAPTGKAGAAAPSEPIAYQHTHRGYSMRLQT